MTPTPDPLREVARPGRVAGMTFRMVLWGKSEAEARQSYAEWARGEPNVDATLLGLESVTGKAWEWVGEIEVTPRQQNVMSFGL